jgi:hypothetical protein
MMSLADGFRRLRESNTLHRVGQADHRSAISRGALFEAMVQQSHTLSQSMHSNAMASMGQAAQGPDPTGTGRILSGGIGMGF